MSIGLLISIVVIESLNLFKLLSNSMPAPLRLTKIIVFADAKIWDNQGFLYHFGLNKQRNGLILKGELGDKVGDNEKELEDVVFARGLDGITDLEVSPDGFLYILSNTQGKIWKIVSSDTNDA